MSETPEMPHLAKSIIDQLWDVIGHAAHHAHEAGKAGLPSDQVALPECLNVQVHELADALYLLASPDNHNASILLPSTLPAGLVEQLQDVVRTEVEKMGRN